MNTNMEGLEPLFPDIPGDMPWLIAGPCSAESEKQVMDTAIALVRAGVKIFRAGIWKPRTRPDHFEGAGVKGLRWLARVKERTGMKVATEVANAGHVRQVLKAGIDMVWLGARTSSNPFAVQEIATALKGSGMPVLVKNPLVPDTELWIGALERLHHAGLRRLAAIHRGFSVFHPSAYRNDPVWTVPIELRRRVPALPLFTDPSHICGSREKIQEVSQKALDLHFDGLFVEVHTDPEHARSDREQQMSPAMFVDMLSQLRMRHDQSQDKVYMAALRDLRQEIDGIDDALLSLLSRRMKISEEIGRVKKEQNVAILQPARWREMLESRIARGESLHLSAGFISCLFGAIHEESITAQERILHS